MNYYIKTVLLFVVIFASTSAKAELITSNATDFFEDVATSASPSLDNTMMWQLGLGTNSNDFLLFDSVNMVSSSVAQFRHSGSAYPDATVNYGATDFTLYGDVNLPAGSMSLHPGNADSLNAILRFTAPLTGLYDFTTLISAADPSQGASTGNIDVSLTTLGLVLDSATIDRVDSGSLPSFYEFIESIYMDEGQVVDFIISRANDQYTDDSTVVNASVVYTSVSEPTSLFLLLSAFLLLIKCQYVRKS